MGIKKTLASLLVAGTCLFGIAKDTKAETIKLDFDSSVSGTIEDASGLGTGFTHRLPRTGYNLPEHDLNLNLSLNSGHLNITSTQADLVGMNMGGLEAYGLSVLDSGNQDIEIEAKFDNVQMGSRLSNQLFLYAANSNGDSIRVGPHFGSFGEIGHIGSSNINQRDLGFFSTGGKHMLYNGEGLILNLNRKDDLWQISWENLTDSSRSGESPFYSFPWLDNEDLQVGILYSSPRTSQKLTSSLDYFSVTSGSDLEPIQESVPEPSTLTLLMGAGLGLGAYSLRRKALRKK